jgi:ABC-type oligopeptide transport system substrate-binding subunit
MQRTVLAVTLGLCLALLAIALPAGLAIGQDLVIAQGADITTLDPTQATQIHNLNLFYNIYDALVTWDPKDIGKLVPELAVSWRSVDPLTWQFKLRQGVSFHNGESFNADAVKFTVDRLITKGVHQVYGGFSTIERADVVDAYTINIVTSKPDPILVKRFAGYGGQILPPQYIKQVDWKTFAIKPVGTGPYKFVEWVKDDRVVLEANPTYWRGAPKIKKVVWRPIPDNFARVAALTRGEAQIITKVIPDHVSQVEKAGCCRVEHTLTNLVTVYLVNAQKGPLANTKVRQALNYAVDKDKIIKELYKGYAIPIGSGIPNTDFGYNAKIKPYPYDPARARQLLAERQRHPPQRPPALRGGGGDAPGRGGAPQGRGARALAAEPAPAHQHLPGPAPGRPREHHLRHRRGDLAPPRAGRHPPPGLAGQLRRDPVLQADGGGTRHPGRGEAAAQLSRGGPDLARRGARALPLPGRADRRGPQRGEVPGAGRSAHHPLRYFLSLI